MKTPSIIFLLLSVLFSSQLYAGSISGKVTYSGSATGTIHIAVFTDTTFNTRPMKTAEADQLGKYTLSDLPAGIYYIVSVMMSGSEIQQTDPWGYYQTNGGFQSVTVSETDSITGVDITLIDPTPEHPNPFFHPRVEPKYVVQLPVALAGAWNPAIVTDGTWFYLYKQDYMGAPSGKVHKFNPYSGDVSSTTPLSLTAGTNQISWIGALAYHKGNFWASGGYGTPENVGRPGVFKVDFGASTASNQLPLHTNIESNYSGGLTSDGTFLYFGVLLKSGTPNSGVVRFNPEQVSEVPPTLFCALSDVPGHLSYGDGCLWAGVDSVQKHDIASGAVLATYNIPPSAAEVYFDEMLWLYNADSNRVEAYEIPTTSAGTGGATENPRGFGLLRNYPNPFNPGSTIEFTVAVSGYVALKVYDALGREVTTLANGTLEAGRHLVRFDGSALPSGIYIARLTNGHQSRLLKMILLK